jgi:hypothetical protein
MRKISGPDNRAAFWNILFSFYFIISPGCKTNGHPVPIKDSSKSVITLHIELRHELPKILKESSGLCFTNGNLWTFCDGGNTNEIYKIDTSTGAILQTVKIENFANIDWEDITADSSYIYIGDFGNNYGSRKDLKIIRIRKSDLNHTDEFLKVNGDAINFNYGDQTSFTPAPATDYNCESVLSLNHSLYLFSKDGIDQQTRCYKLPDQPGNYTISPISSFDTKGKVTAAAFDPLSKEIALLGYTNKKLESFIWFLDDYSGDDFFEGTHIRITIGSGKDWQTEGLDYITSNRLFMTCETSKKVPASLYYIRKD